MKYATTYYDIECGVVGSPNADWDGISYIQKNMLFITYVSIYLNSAATETYQNTSARKSVAVHEFGHAMGLDEDGSNRTIMNDHTWGTNSRYGTYGLTTPQSADKTALNNLY